VLTDRSLVKWKLCAISILVHLSGFLSYLRGSYEAHEYIVWAVHRVSECYSTGFQPLFVQKNTKKCIRHSQYCHFIVSDVEFSIMVHLFYLSTPL
jgi:hypothetical protein